MPKVRIELVPDFGPRKGQVMTGIVVDSNYDALLKAAQNKLQLKKKEASNVTMYCVDFAGRQALREGDLSEILHNGMKVIVLQGGPAPEMAEGQPMKPKLSKRTYFAVEQLQLVKVGRGALSARGRPSLETIAALQEFKAVTGVVTLLRHDECLGGAATIGLACKRIGLKWCHAPLAGPKEMGMIGEGKAHVTAEDLDSFRQVHQLKTWLHSGEENLVVHCAAGLHRTGIFLYVLLRELGDVPEEALEKIRQMRQETFDEFTRLKFHAKAEAVFAIVGSGSRGDAGDAASAVELVATRAGGMEEAEVEAEEEEVEGDDDDEADEGT